MRMTFAVLGGGPPRRRVRAERRRWAVILANALFESGEVAEAMETAARAVALNPLRPPYYYLFNAMILWGNERYQEALDEAEACLRMAPDFTGAGTYRAVALVGLGQLDEAKAQLKQCMARPGGIVIVTPHPPELARRALADLQAAGWQTYPGRRTSGGLGQPFQQSSETFSGLSGPGAPARSKLQTWRGPVPLVSPPARRTQEP